jgi:hypothetical protein
MGIQKEQAQKILYELRRNARISVRLLAKKLHVPKSTIFDVFRKFSGLRFIAIIDLDRYHHLLIIAPEETDAASKLAYCPYVNNHSRAIRNHIYECAFPDKEIADRWLDGIQDATKVFPVIATKKKEALVIL